MSDTDLIPQAGPSRLPLQNHSPRRSTSLTHRQRGKLPIAITGTTDMTFLNPSRPAGITISPFAQSYHHDLLLPPRTPTHPRFQDDDSSPTSIRRSASDEGSQRSRSYTDPIWPTHLDQAQSALLQHVRVKVSEQDQEAMRKLRSTMAAQAMSRGPSGANSTKQEFPDRETVSTLGADQAERRDDVDKTPRPCLPPPFSIAVVGHKGVGKTTVIRRAAKVWGVSDSMTALLPNGHRITSSHSQILPGGKLKEARMVEFIELDIDSLNLSPECESIWVSGIPSISGVILCYDAARVDTLGGIKEALHKLSQESTPMIVLACKSDPEVPLEVDAAYGNSLGEPYNVGLIEVTALSAEGKSKMRNGLRWLLFKLEQRSRRRQRRPSPLNLPQISSSRNGTAPPKPIPPDIQSPDSEGHSSGGERIMWGHARQLAMTSSEVEESDPDHMSSSGSLQWIMNAPISSQKGHGVSMEARDAQMNQMQELQVEVGQQELGAAAKELRNVDGLRNASGGLSVVTPQEAPEPQLWLTMDELYRRLFSSIVTDQNERFLSTFLLCYRRFSAPLDLMREFRTRFRDIDTAEISKDVRMLALQRLVGALIDWMCQYPGDVIGEKAQTVFREILASTLRYTFLAHLAAELVAIEADLIDVEDIDLSWSIDNKQQSSLGSSSLSAELPAGSQTDLMSTDEKSSDRPDSPATRKDASTSALSLASSNVSNGDRTTSLSVPRPSGAEARGFTVVYSAGYPKANGSGEDFGFGKWSQAWDTFIRSDPRTFAVELTRLQWQKFSAIRPRDVFRHDFGKEKEGPVGEAIDFFNQISRWVSTMILANPKPKHRARTYERFLLIAHHLRCLNNYDSLYACISGMRETSILRLGQTHALVSPLVPGYKEFMGYVKLMDPRNGYAVYRKTLESDLEHASSAIPLLTIILGLVNRLQSVRRVDKREDGTVQWDKFEKFGEILSVISDCHNRGPMVPGDVSPSFQNLIENTNLIDSEDGLYERSRMLEPPNGAVQGGGRVLKKLANLGLT